MENKMKTWLLQIFTTKIGWLGLTLFLSVVFGILANFYSWAETAMFICWLYPVGLTIVMIVYGWIINPIKKYMSKKKQ